MGPCISISGKLPGKENLNFEVGELLEEFFDAVTWTRKGMNWECVKDRYLFTVEIIKVWEQKEEEQLLLIEELDLDVLEDYYRLVICSPTKNIDCTQYPKQFAEIIKKQIFGGDGRIEVNH